MIVRVLSAAFLAAMLAAVLLQAFGDALPLGLFNEGRQAYERFSVVTLVLAGSALLVLAGEFLVSRDLRAAAWVRGALAAALLLEGMVFAIDVTLVSRGADPPLGGPYREFQSEAGEWLFVKKPHSGSLLGFRTHEPYPKRTDAPRVLFLGDSYTEGSGHDVSCNYPEVAATTLAELRGRPVAVMNAGVAGYGPRDTVRLLRHLLAEGYQADAIVYGLFLENDFSDNLPGTSRRVVAGINFRFPESAFLRAFHPLNSRSFRYALFVERASRIPLGRGGPALRDEGACERTARTLSGEIPSGLARLVRRRLSSNYGPEARTALGEVGRAFEELRRVAGDRPVFLVVFPDRLLVDDGLAQALDIDRSSYATGRLTAWVDDVWPDAIHVAPALVGGAENYRSHDTHLSDLGNLRAGRWVGQALAERLSW